MLFWKPFYVLLCFISFLFLFRKKRRILWKHDFGWWSADLKIIFIYSSSLRGEARWQEQPDSFPESKQGWLTRVLLKSNIGKLFFSKAPLTKSQDFCAMNPSKGSQFLLVEFFYLWTKVNFLTWGAQHADGPESFWRRWNKSSATSTAAGSCKTKSMVRGDKKQTFDVLQLCKFFDEPFLSTSEHWRSSEKLQSFCCKIWVAATCMFLLKEDPGAMELICRIHNLHMKGEEFFGDCGCLGFFNFYSGWFQNQLDSEKKSQI